MASKDHFLKFGCAAVVILLALPVALVLNWMREPFGPAYVVQSRKPLGLAEAKQISGLPIPDAARDIRVASFRQWIAFELFVRFEAPVPDCIAFAERVIADPGRTHAETKAAGLAKFDGPIGRSVGSSTGLETAWFDIQDVRHGLEGGSGLSHRPKVWIDTERGVCYYRITD